MWSGKLLQKTNEINIIHGKIEMGLIGKQLEWDEGRNRGRGNESKEGKMQAMYLTAHNNMAPFYSVLYCILYIPIACNFTFSLGILRKV